MWNVRITGGVGFIGSHLIEELQRGGSLYLVNLDLKTGVDLTDKEQVEQAVHNADTVFDLAAMSLFWSLRTPYKVCLNNYLIALNLCEACRLGVFKELVHISSSEAFGSAIYTPMDEKHPTYPTTPYAASKLCADHIIKSYVNTFGIKALIIRPFNNYGPRQPLDLGGVIPTTIHKILKGEKPVIYGTGEQKRDFIYVKDTVRGIVELSKTPKDGKIINLGTGKSSTIKRVIEIICDLMNYKGGIEYKEGRVADVFTHEAGVKLAEEYGFVPRISLEEGLKETVDWYEDTFALPDNNIKKD